MLQSLPAVGFERFCQRLLRESGFQEVTITGRSGDGGIDGIGILQVNALVSFKVLFQQEVRGLGHADGEKLAETLEKLELGLRPRQTFDVDASFFEEYKK